MVLLPLKYLKYMQIEFSEITDVGKVRKANEDSQGNLKTAEGHVFVVSDGMGGHVGGATASALSVKCILEYFSKPLVTDPALAIADAIQFANTQVYATALHNKQLSGMGATCVVLYLSNDGRAWYGHAGDSRIYHQRGSDLTRLTKDHSWVQFLVDTGEISAEEAETHPEKNRILRALGIEEDIRPEVCSQPIEICDGDRFLLCSDGLSGLVNDKELKELCAAGEVEAASRALMDLALERGGHDNISVSLVRVGDTGKTITLSLAKKRPQKKYRWALMFGVLASFALLLAWWLAQPAAVEAPRPMPVKGQDSTRKFDTLTPRSGTGVTRKTAQPALRKESKDSAQKKQPFQPPQRGADTAIRRPQTK